MNLDAVVTIMALAASLLLIAGMAMMAWEVWA